MKYLTAGESHGKMLVGILEGMPAGLTLDFDRIDQQLALRQSGYGRGARMKIERDSAEFVSGLRDGVTLGSPIAVLIKNNDHEHWTSVMDCRSCDTTQRVVTQPRPGHADYVGCKKFGHLDARNILERASARNTASIVALGAVAEQLLEVLGVRLCGYVTGIGRATCQTQYPPIEKLIALADASVVRTLDADAEAAMIAEIDQAIAADDTVGGQIRVIVSGLKPGIGSCMEQEYKLDGLLAGTLMGMQGIKSVSVGDADRYATAFGTAVHDAMYPNEHGVRRETNHAGGIEGGMSNGEDVVLNLVFKPIPTTRKGLPTVDLVSGEAVTSSKERSDICAVPAASVVAKAYTALTLVQAILNQYGGSNMKEILQRWNA